MKSLIILGLVFGLACANLNDFTSLLSYKGFAKDFAKEAVVTFAENLAEEGSNDFCQDFATFLAKAAVDKYSAMENKVRYSERVVYLGEIAQMLKRQTVEWAIPGSNSGKMFFSTNE